MKKLICTLITLLLASTISASPIGPMSYQGRLLDNNGVPVNNLSGLEFKVRLYDDIATGALQFEEQHSAVPIKDGVYSFLIGTGTVLNGAWDLSLWNSGTTLYLELEVDGETLAPRSMIASAPRSFQATNTEMLDNKPAEDYAEDTDIQEVKNQIIALCAAQGGVWLNVYEICATRGADLSNLDLSGIDFSGLDLGSANFTNTTLTNTLFNEAILYRAKFNGASFSGTSFDSAFLSRATFDGIEDLATANFSGVSAQFLSVCPSTLPTDWSCIHDGNVFGYFLIGPNASFYNPIWEISYEFKRPLHNFSDLNLSNVDFSGMKLPFVTFKNTNLTNAVFDNAIFSKGYFENATLNSTSFNGTTFYAVTFNNQGFDQANLTNIYTKDLPNCPSTLPANWECAARGNGNILYGPSVRFNDEVYGAESWSDADCNLFDNKNLTGADFSNNSFEMDCQLFQYATAHNINFNNISAKPSVGNESYVFSRADLTGSTFIGANLLDVYMTQSRPGSPTINNVNFSNTNLMGSWFEFCGIPVDIYALGVITSAATICPDGSSAINEQCDWTTYRDENSCG